MRFYSEKKYIIYRKYGKLKHFIFPSCHSHFYFARDNGIDYHNEVVETGLLIECKPIIVECKDKKHLLRHSDSLLYSDKTIKARACESRYLYKSKVYSLPQGD